MTDEHWREVDSLFSRALDYPPGERAPFLARECDREGGTLRVVWETPQGALPSASCRWPPPSQAGIHLAESGSLEVTRLSFKVANIPHYEELQP